MSNLLKYIKNIIVILDDKQKCKPWEFIKKMKINKKFKSICNNIDDISIFELCNDLYNIFSSNMSLPVHRNIIIGTNHIKFNIDDNIVITYILRGNYFTIYSDTYIYEVYSINNHYSGNYNRWISTSDSLRKIIYKNIFEIINYISSGGIIEYGEGGKYICRTYNKQEKEVRLEKFITEAAYSKKA